MVAPIYLTYRTYRLFLARLDEQRRHVDETQRLHRQTVEALLQARKAEQALAAEKERLAVTLRSIADGIVTTDLDGTVLSINRVAETLTGWTQQQAAGQPLSTVFRNCDPETREPCDNSIAMLEQRARTPGAGRCTILVGRDLAERPIEENTAIVCDAAGRAIGMVLTFRDIKDALKIQEERAKVARLSSLGHLAGGIAHDFNDVLMAITGNVSIARATIPPVEPAVTALTEAEHGCVRARQLTWRLLSFAKGGIPHKQTLALGHVLRDAAARVLRGSPVTCSFDCAPDLWNVLADESQLVEVFGNLLVNAQQAMPDGGAIVVRAENVYESARRGQPPRIPPGRYVRVSIADKGIGIPKENLSRIFDPYFTTKQRGSGLGLATTHSIVKNHGGYVAVDSELGVGTTVQVTLPVSDACTIAASASSMSPSRRAGQRVLVVDDEEPVRRLTMNMLQFLGYDTEVVDNGNAAVERFTHALQTGHPFDVVILDLIMSGGPGGEEALTRLAQIDPSVKAILMSGYSQDAIMSEFRHSGFHAAIDKPFTLQELSATLESVVASPHHPVH
jgi:PAS domain S-box-containing protein